MSTLRAGNTALTHNRLMSTSDGDRRARNTMGTPAALRLLAGFASFALLVGIGFIGQWGQALIPQAQAAGASRGQPVSHQEATPVWTPLTNQHAVWSEDLDEDGVYWIDDNSNTPSSTSAAAIPILFKDYNWSDDMSTYSVKSVLSFKRDASGGPSLDAETTLASLAIGRIGGTQDNPGGKLTAYFWDWNAPASSGGLSCTSGHTPIIRVTSGESTIYSSCMPSMQNGGTAAGRYPPALGQGGGTGGEVDQFTGNIYVTAQQGASVDGEGATSYAANTNGSWSFLVWNPQTGAYSMSGAVQPGDLTAATIASRTVPTERAKLYVNTNGTGNSSAGTTEAPADFAMDADGNVYAAVGTSIGSSATATYNSKMVRMEPARDADGNIVDGSLANPWRYYVVQSFVKDPAFANWGYGSPGSTWGNPFMNGQMFLGSSNSISAPSSWTRPSTVLNTGYGTFLMEKLDPLTGLIRPVWSTQNSSDVRSAASRDDGSPQQAEVIRGTIYNDANGNSVIDDGEAGIPGQKIGLYDTSGKLLSIQTTDSSGEYSFIVSGVAGLSYYVRPTQIAITTGGVTVNAAQTWGAGSHESGFNSTGDSVWNTAGIVCYNQSAPITSADGDVCYGAINPASADPALGVLGSTSDPATWLSYGQVELNTSQAVPSLDFGYTTFGSYGDAKAGPTSANVPVHINPDPNSSVWLGDNLGKYAGAASDNSAHNGSDDGMFVKSYAGNIPLQGELLAATGSYNLVADVSGPAASSATVKGWVTGANNDTWNTTAAWDPAVNNGAFQFQTSGAVSNAQTVQFRAEVSTAAITLPTNGNGEYFSTNASTSGANWTTPGEIEDYTFQIADSVYRPAVKTTSGTATFIVDGQSLDANPAAYHIGASKAATVNQPVSITAQAPDSSWILQSATVKNLDGTDQGTATVTPVDSTHTTVSWTPGLGDDVIVDLVYGKAVSAEKSTLELDKPSTIVNTFITAKATVKDVDGTALSNQTVTFSKKSADITLSKSTCTTNDEGYCTVTVTSGVAGTYTEELSATVAVDGAQTQVSGSPKTVTFTAGTADPGNSSLAVSPGGPLTVGTGADNTYTATSLLKDSGNNPVSGQEVRYTVTNADSSPVTSVTALSAPSCNTGIDGKCDVKLTSTKSGTYMIEATIQDPQDSTKWVPILQSPATVVYVPGPVDPNHSSVAVTKNGSLNDGVEADEITGTTQDSYGNPVLATVEIATTDSALNIGTGHIVTDQTTGKGILKVTSLVAGPHTATATINGTAVSGSPLQLNFVAQSAVPENSTLSLSSPEQSVGTPVTATVTARDANNTVVEGVTVNFAVNGPSQATFTDDKQVCTTDENGVCTVTFTDTKPDTVVIHARLSSADTIDIKDSPATTQFIAGPADEKTSTIVANPKDVAANGTDSSTITVTLKDHYGNTIPHPTDTVEIISILGDLTSVVNNDNGTYAADLTSATPGEATVSFTVNSKAGTDIDTVTFSNTAFCANCSSWTVTPTTSAASGSPVANGNSTTTDYWTGVLTAKDDAGNLLSDLDVSKVAFTPSTPDVHVSAVTNTANGTYTVKFTSAKAGKPTASVTYENGSKVGPTTDLEIAFQAGPADAETSEIAANPTSVPANGSDFSTITVTVKDKDGNVVTSGGDLVGLSSTLGEPSEVTDNADGTYTATLSSSQTGVAAVSYTVNGDDGNGVATVSFGTGEPVAAKSSWTVSPTTSADSGSPVANGNSTNHDYWTGVVTARDANDALLPDLDVSVIHFAASSDDVVISDVANTGNGTYTVRFTSTVAADPTASVTFTGSTDKVGPTADQPIPFQAGPVCVPGDCTPEPWVDSDHTTRADVSPNNAVANGTATDGVNVHAFDKDGNPVQATFTLASTDNGVTLALTSVPTNSAGDGSTTATSTVASGHPVSVVVDGKTLQESPLTLTFVPGPADPTKSEIVASPTSVPANGTDTSLITVTLKDKNGNTLTSGGDTVTILPTLGTKSDVTDKDNGTYTATLSSTTTGTSTVHYTVNGQSGARTATVVFENGVFSADKSSWTIAATTTADEGDVPVANGNSTGGDYWTGVLTALDNGGAIMENLDVSSVHFAASSSNVVISDVTNTGNGTYTVKFTSAKSGDYTANVTVNDSDQVKPVDQVISFQPGPVCVPGDCTPEPGVDAEHTTRAEVNPDGALANGQDADVVHVYAFDKDGNAVDQVPFTLESTDNQVTLAATSRTTAAGQAATNATSAISGQHLVAVTIDGKPLPNITATFVPGQASAEMSTLSVDRSSQTVKQPIVATVTAKDGSGNTLTGYPVVVTVDKSAVLGSATPGVQTYTCLTGTNGTCNVSITDRVAENVTIHAKVNDNGETDVSGSPVTVTFTAGPVCIAPSCLPDTDVPDSNRTRVEVTTNDKPYGTGTDVATVYAFDQSGNPVPGATVASTTTDPVLSITGSIPVTNASGVSTISYTSKAAGGHKAAVTIDGTPVAFWPQGGTAIDPGKSSPITLNFIDTVAPIAPTVTSPQPGALLKDSTPEVTGVAEPGSTVTVKDKETGDTLCTAVADVNGNYRCTPETALDEGPTTLSVTATDDSGNESLPTEVPITVDSVAPAAPVITTANKNQISGTTEPGSTVTLTVPGVTAPVVVTPDPQGNWSTPTPAGAQDGDVTATATDPAGNESDPATAYLDATAPAGPVINVANKTEVAGRNGSTEPNSTVKVTFPDGQVKTTTADGNGAWTIPTPAGMDSGDVTATSTDAAGNVSPVTTAHLDTDVPDAPRVDTANGTEVAGGEHAAEPGATVTVTFPDGTKKTTTANPDGSYSVPTPDGTHSGDITVTVTDPAGNQSDPTEATIDTDAPAAPKIDTANGTEVSGKPGAAEGGSTVTVTFPDGTVKTTTANPDGSYKVDTPANMPTGGQVVVTATDPAGNTSAPTTKLLDTKAPDAPVIKTANGTQIAGTAEADSIITVTIPGVADPVTTTTDGNGDWLILTPSTAENGTITATATDRAGNISPKATAILDVIAPDAPTITRADATQISGTAEKGSTVTLKVPGVTAPITVVVDGDGNWSIPTPDGAIDGTVHATATDPAGNISGEATAELDVTPPAEPVVNPTNGTEVSGTSEPGAIITVTDENGQKVPGCDNVKVGDDGTFGCTPVTPLTPGSEVTVVARDASGKDSPAVTVKIVAVRIEIAYPERHLLESQVVTGYHFTVGEQVCLVVDSEPLQVGCETADDQGNVTFTFTVPENFDLGAHTATLTGGTSKLSASASFSVIASPVVNTGGTSLPQGDNGLLYGVLASLVAASAGIFLGIRRMGIRGVHTTH